MSDANIPMQIEVIEDEKEPQINTEFITINTGIPTIFNPNQNCHDCEKTNKVCLCVKRLLPPWKSGKVTIKLEKDLPKQVSCDKIAKPSVEVSDTFLDNNRLVTHKMDGMHTIWLGREPPNKSFIIGPTPVYT